MTEFDPLYSLSVLSLATLQPYNCRQYELNYAIKSVFKYFNASIILIISKCELNKADNWWKKAVVVLSIIWWNPNLHLPYQCAPLVL